MRRTRISSQSEGGSMTPLEPRVAKLEVGLDRLTADVSNLATVVREQGSSMEQEIQKLVVAVTQAAGPRKTDWSTIIAAVMMVMAIGAAVLIPLNQTSQENKAAIQELHTEVITHQALDNHPVGAALVQRLEEQAKTHRDMDDKERETMRVHFHEELDLVTKNYEQQLQSLQAKVDLHNDRLYARVVNVESVIQHDRDSDLNELRLWRIRAMSGDIQSKSPVSTDILFDPHVPKITEPKTVTPPTVGPSK